jgi:hypothetical protein
MNTKIFSFKDGVEYLNANGLVYEDNDHSLQIPSTSCYVYRLPKGEIFVFPIPWGSSPYPAVLFSNEQAFHEACEKESFPIPDVYLTWLERHAKPIRDFTVESDFYKTHLFISLGINIPFKNKEDIDDARKKVAKLLKKKGMDKKAKESIFFSYSLEVIKYSIEYSGLTYCTKKRYEVYNPYYYPYFTNAKGKYIDILGEVQSMLMTQSENMFNDVFNVISGKE